MGRDRERYQIPYGARLKVAEDQQVENGQILVEWDPYTFSILTEETGQIRFKDIVEGLTVHEDLDEVTGCRGSSSSTRRTRSGSRRSRSSTRTAA
jgi:DNA-directed RNA polymerase subunit beta'